MPSLPNPVTTPFDTVGNVLQLARVVVNDAFGPNGVAGDILTDINPGTLIYLNTAWRYLQDELANAEVEALVKEVLFEGLDPVTIIDPSTETYLAWDGYYYGTGVDQNFLLPFDMIQPSYLWERPSGSGAQFCKMIPLDGGLPGDFPVNVLRFYEWRGNQLAFKGATVPVDVRLRYLAYFGDFVNVISSNPPQVDETQQVPIMRCTRALALLIAADFARTRGSDQADTLSGLAESEIDKITNRTARRKAAITYRRKPFGSRPRF